MNTYYLLTKCARGTQMVKYPSNNPRMGKKGLILTFFSSSEKNILETMDTALYHHCAWTDGGSSDAVRRPLVPRNGESELIERDLSGVEGRVAHTGLQLRISRPPS